jgi:hypothetical protein
MRKKASSSIAKRPQKEQEDHQQRDKYARVHTQVAMAADMAILRFDGDLTTAA